MSDHTQLADWIRDAGLTDQIEAAVRGIDRRRARYADLAAPERRQRLHEIFEHIDLSRNEITLKVNRASIIAWLLDDCAADALDSTGVPTLAPITITVPIDIKRRGVETRMILSDGNTVYRQPDAGLVQLVAKAHTYLAKLTDGAERSLTQIAAECRTELSEVSRILPLAFLAPSIVDAIMSGRQSPSLTAQKLLRLSDLPILWHEQVDLLG